MYMYTVYVYYNVCVSVVISIHVHLLVTGGVMCFCPSVCGIHTCSLSTRRLLSLFYIYMYMYNVLGFIMTL